MVMRLPRLDYEETPVRNRRRLAKPPCEAPGVRGMTRRLRRPRGPRRRVLELVTQINISLNAIVEPQMKDVLSYPFRLCHSDHGYSNGGMG